MAVEFFDMAVSLTPPTGHVEPYPLLLGPNWRPNDVRLLMVSASGQNDAGLTASAMEMRDDPPTSFSTAYALYPTDETEGVYYRRLISGDADSSVSWEKPSGWRHFVWATLTARGLNPAVNPVGGRLSVTHTVASGAATVASVTVPAAGIMIFCLGTVPDPGSGGLRPKWAAPINVPSSWTHLVATDKSGNTFFEFDTNPHILVVAKSFTAGGSTGAVTFPVGLGSPAFCGLWCFVRVAQDTAITVGAA